MSVQAQNNSPNAINLKIPKHYHPFRNENSTVTSSKKTLKTGKRHPNLIFLDRTLNESLPKGQDLQTFLNVANDTKFTKNVSIDLYNMFSINDCKVLQVKNLAKRMKGIEGLSITTRGREMSTDAVIRNLVQTIRNFRSLKKLSLTFYSSDFNEKDIKILRKLLSGLTKLTSLSLDFDCNQINDNDVANLSKTIQKFTLLTNLSLQFHSRNQITDIGFEKINKNIASLASLESLLLNFRA